MFDTLIVKSSNKISPGIRKKYNLEDDNFFLEITGDIENIDCTIDDIKDEKVIITSINALHATKKLPINTGFIVVGGMVKSGLQALGFSNISTFKNIDNLLVNIDKNAHYTYLRGAIISQEIAPHFTNIKEQIVYKIHYFSKLSETAFSAIKSGEIKRIFTFSYASTENFLQMIKVQNLTREIQSINFHTISPKSLDLLKKTGIYCNLIEYEI